MQNNNPKAFFVAGLTRGLSENSLARYFEQYGRVEKMQIVHNREGQSLGYGFLTIFTDDAQSMLSDTHRIGDSVIRIEYAERHALKTKLVTPTLPPAPPKAAPARDSLKESSYDNHKRPREEARHESPRPHSHSQAPRPENIAPPMAASMATVRELQSRNSPPQHESSAHQNTAYLTAPCVATPLAEPLFACIPLSICPPTFLRDPRVFCCTLDPSQVGKLTIVESPVAQLSTPGLALPSPAPAPTIGSVVYSQPPYVQLYPASQAPPPPPPGPPPPHVVPVNESEKLSTASQNPVPLPPPGPLPQHNSAPSARPVPPPPGPPPQRGNTYTSLANSKSSPMPYSGHAAAPSNSGHPSSAVCVPPRFISPPHMMNPPPPGPPPRR